MSAAYTPVHFRLDFIMEANTTNHYQTAAFLFKNKLYHKFVILAILYFSFDYLGVKIRKTFGTPFSIMDLSQIKRLDET